MGGGGGDGLTKGLVCGEEVLELMCRDGGGGRGWSHQGACLWGRSVGTDVSGWGRGEGVVSPRGLSVGKKCWN